MDIPLFIVLALTATLVGTALGTMTGLLPGLHTNNICAILISVHFPIVVVLEDHMSELQALILIMCLMVSAAMTHTFVNFVPATFLGAPEGDTALSILPGHRMLLEGRGEVAIRLSAVGSLGALLICLGFVVAIRGLMGDPVHLYSRSRPFIPLLLILMAILLVISERRSTGKMWAALILVMSGILGQVALDPNGLSNHNWIPISVLGLPVGGWALMPLFVGLFGLPTLIISFLSTQVAPLQLTGLHSRLSNRRKARGILVGTVSGALVGWYPGITSAQAGVIATKATPASQEDGPVGSSLGSEEFIVSVSAINTANAISNFVALYTIGRARSGSAKAVKDLLDPNLERWDAIWSVPSQLVVVLLVVLVSGLLAYMITRWLGRVFARNFHKIPYRPLVLSIIVSLVVLVLLFSGPVGMVIMSMATVLGLIPPLVGIRRVHLMGCLILPIVIGWYGLVPL